MDARRTTLSIGWSIVGAGMGIAAGSNMLDVLPDGLAPVAFGLLGVGATLVVIGRYLLPQSEVNPPAPTPDETSESN